MIRETGFKSTPKKDKESPKKDSLLRKAFNKIDDFGPLRLAKWLATAAFAAAVAGPPIYGLGAALSTSPHPSLADEESWYIFFDKTGDGYGTVANTVLWPFKQASKLTYQTFGDGDGLTGEPTQFTICKPLDSLRDGHYQYYKDLDRKLQNILANQASNEKIQKMLDNGYTPIIKYTTPHMKQAGNLLLSHAPVEHRNTKNPTCGSNMYRAETVNIMR